MLASLTAQPDPDRNRVRLELSRSDSDTVQRFWLTRDQAWQHAQEVILAAQQLTPEPEDQR